jgi:hypothetical protein
MFWFISQFHIYNVNQFVALWKGEWNRPFQQNFCELVHILNKIKDGSACWH